MDVPQGTPHPVQMERPLSGRSPTLWAGSGCSRPTVARAERSAAARVICGAGAGQPCPLITVCPKGRVPSRRPIHPPSKGVCSTPAVALANGFCGHAFTGGVCPCRAPVASASSLVFAGVSRWPFWWGEEASACGSLTADSVGPGSEPVSLEICPSSGLRPFSAFSRRDTHMPMFHGPLAGHMSS